MQVTDIRARHIKGCIENGKFEFRGEIRTPSPNVKSSIKTLFNLMLDYALEYELVEKNYARTFVLSQDIKLDKEKQLVEHISFSNEEMDILWSNYENTQNMDLILIQCYTGLRPQEIGLIELKNVDLENHYFVGGLKTEAGKDRTVPIHSKIYPLIKDRYEKSSQIGSKYLITVTHGKTKEYVMLGYERYRFIFKSIIKSYNLNPNHRPHDGRKHFITKAKEYNVNEFAIKYIVGHAISDITEKVYTERNIKWLIEEIERIK